PIPPSPRSEEGRYRLLETLREYTWEQLEGSGVRVQIQARHRDWYLRLAEQAQGVTDLSEQKEWLRQLDAELDNLRVALKGCQEAATGDGVASEIGLRLAGALALLWINRGYFAEGVEWLEGTLERGTEASPLLRARTMVSAAAVAGTFDGVRCT